MNLTFKASRARSLTKTLVYRAVGSIETFLIVWVVGGSIEQASAAAIILALVKLCVYYLHERMWNLINWGKEKSNG